MGVEELLSARRDVSFPVHADDSGNVDGGPSVFYGFTPDGVRFHDHWELHFTSPARITACFTGLLYVSNDGGGEYSLLLYSYANRPDELVYHNQYPMPGYARYRPFSDTEIEAIAENLLTSDTTALETLIGPCSDEVISGRASENSRRFRTLFRESHPEEPIPDDPSPFIDELKADFLVGTLSSGIPVNAVTILAKLNREIDIYFHPSNLDRTIDLSLTYNLNYYFTLWRSVINLYDSYPASFRQNVIGPPVSSGNIIYVKATPDPSFTPLYADLYDAIQHANAAGRINDTILILDNAEYHLRGLDRFVSIIGLVDADDDVRSHAELSDGSLTTALRDNYPGIQNPPGQRGLWISYEQGEPDPKGLIYVSNLSISGNTLDVTAELGRVNLGGAGVFIDGNYFEYVGDERTRVGHGFSQVHLHNCAVCSNQMTNFPSSDSLPEGVDAPGVEYGGGGLLCYYSSPVISNCLIRGNTSYFHGGGIGIIKYGWPLIKDNTISHNTAGGHPYGDMDGGIDRGGNGDGGGIGVFQAYPVNRYAVEATIGYWDAIDGSLRDRLFEAWDADDLHKAKTRWIPIWRNRIHNNAAEMSGGGVYCTVCALLSLFDNQIYENNAVQQDGGGVCTTYGSRLRINGSSHSQNTIHNNRATRRGGGLYIRSSKVMISNCSICENGDASPSSTLEGGGITVVSRAEITSVSGLPIYDIILHIIFDHIDQVLLEARSLELRDNTAPIRGDFYVVRDISGYTRDYRDILEPLDLVCSLPIHVSLECTNPIRDVIDAGIILINRDGSSVIVTPDYISANSLENTV